MPADRTLRLSAWQLATRAVVLFVVIGATVYRQSGGSWGAALAAGVAAAVVGLVLIEIVTRRAERREAP